MLLYTNLDDFNLRYIYLSEKIKNTVLDNGYFIRIIYSDTDVALNGIYLNISIDNDNFNTQSNMFSETTLNKLQNIEKEILNKYNTNKTKIFKLNNIFLTKNIRFFNTNNDNIKNIILKISGLWEDSTTYGLTFKLISYY